MRREAETRIEDLNMCLKAGLISSIGRLGRMLNKWRLTWDAGLCMELYLKKLDGQRSRNIQPNSGERR